MSSIVWQKRWAWRSTNGQAGFTDRLLRGSFSKVDEVPWVLIHWLSRTFCKHRSWLCSWSITITTMSACQCVLLLKCATTGDSFVLPCVMLWQWPLIMQCNGCPVQSCTKCSWFFMMLYFRTTQIFALWGVHTHAHTHTHTHTLFFYHDCAMYITMLFFRWEWGNRLIRGGRGRGGWRGRGCWCPRGLWSGDKGDWEWPVQVHQPHNYHKDHSFGYVVSSVMVLGFGPSSLSFKGACQ